MFQLSGFYCTSSRVCRVVRAVAEDLCAPVPNQARLGFRKPGLRMLGLRDFGFKQIRVQRLTP